MSTQGPSGPDSPQMWWTPEVGSGRTAHHVPAANQVRWVPASDDHYGTLTVRETLALTVTGSSPAHIDEVISWVGLAGREDAWVQRLSAPELRRRSPRAH